MPRAAVALPVEEGVDDDGVHGCLGGVSALETEGVVWLVGEKVERILELSLDGLGVGVEEKLGGVAAQAVSRIPRPVDAVAVAVARAHLRHVHVPHVGVHLGHRDAHFVEIVVEQAQRDCGGDRRVDREVRAGSIKRGAQRVRLTRSSFHTTKGGMNGL